MTIPELKWQDFPHEIPEGTRVRVTDRDNQIYVVKNGQWELEIVWTKCSERMPPDDMPMIIVKLENSTEVFKYTRIRLKTYFASYRDIYARIAALSKTSWTPYTPEAWAELNRK